MASHSTRMCVPAPQKPHRSLRGTRTINRFYRWATLPAWPMGTHARSKFTDGPHCLLGLWVHTERYAQMGTHTDGHTHRWVHTQMGTHTDGYTHRWVHTDGYTHRWAHTQMGTHTDGHTHRWVHTQMGTHRWVHTDGYTHRWVHAQMGTNTDGLRCVLGLWVRTAKKWGWMETRKENGKPHTQRQSTPHID